MHNKVAAMWHINYVAQRFGPKQTASTNNNRNHRIRKIDDAITSSVGKTINAQNMEHTKFIWKKNRRNASTKRHVKNDWTVFCMRTLSLSHNKTIRYAIFKCTPFNLVGCISGSNIDLLVVCTFTHSLFWLHLFASKPITRWYTLNNNTCEWKK